jgi:hypothetical protein
MNERMNDRTNDRNFGSITAEQRLFGRTNGRTIEQSDERAMNYRTTGRTNEQTKNRWTNDRRTTERSLCQCVLVWEMEWARVGGRGRVAIKWLGVA